jgi:hypothetical protein
MLSLMKRRMAFMSFERIGHGGPKAGMPKKRFVSEDYHTAKTQKFIAFVAE